MTEIDDRLTFPQMLGMLCLGICVWAIIIGLIYAIVKWTYIGLIIAGTGGVGALVLLGWLIWINKSRKK